MNLHSTTSTMPMSAVSKHSPEYVAIRKLRKKLRQIETLERCDRLLQENEILKVSKKYEIRNELNQLLSRITDNISDVSADVSGDISIDSISIDSISDVLHSTEEHGQGDADFFLTTEILDCQSSSKPADTESSNSEPCNDLADDESKVNSARHSSVSDNIPDVCENNSGANVGDSPMSSPPSSPEKTAPQTSSSQDSLQTLPLPLKHTKKPKSIKSADKTKAVRKKWSQSKFSLTCLEGHTDLITCVVIYDDFVVSGSRDTTIKVHSLTTSLLLHNLGGHTNTVTSVCLLSQDVTSEIIDDTMEHKNTAFIISGSLDCFLKIWCLNSGKLMKEIYTFDAITCLAHDIETGYVLTGSEGGKIAMFNVVSGETITQLTPYHDKVTALVCTHNLIYSASSEDTVMVHEIKGHDLVCIYVSESMKSTSGHFVTFSTIHSLTVNNGLLYVGDDGANVKILHWKSGTVHKLSNNVGEFGSTDSVCFTSHNTPLMLSSAYDIDHGLGYINVRSAKGGDYITTLNSTDVGRITCLASSHVDGLLNVVSGGEDLILWKQLPNSIRETTSDTTIMPKYLAVLARTAVDSEVESDLSDIEIHRNEDSVLADSRRLLLSQSEYNNTTSSWTSWCNLL